MKVATARYTGRMRGQTFRAPSGESYSLPHTGEAIPIEDEDDAEFLDSKLNVEVEWTNRGKVHDLLQGVSGSISDALDEIGYSEKQEVVSETEAIDVPGNAAEDEMDQAIRDHLEDME